MVRHPHRQNALLSENSSVHVPAHHRGDDLILVVPSPSDEELVITGSDGAARPLAQACDERPGVGQRRIAVHGMHGTTWGESDDPTVTILRLVKVRTG